MRDPERVIDNSNLFAHHSSLVILDTSTTLLNRVQWRAAAIHFRCFSGLVTATLAFSRLMFNALKLLQVTLPFRYAGGKVTFVLKGWGAGGKLDFQ
jgi:hypothetical protein